MTFFATNPRAGILPRALLLAGSLVCVAVTAAPKADVAAVRDQWEQVNFVVAGPEREGQFMALTETCDSLLATQPDNAEALTWCGIVESSYAGVAGGLGALKHAKAARKYFERAIDIDRNTVNGAALTSLGTLYAKVPGWPIGFGDDKKARKYLEEGLQANPDGMDSHFFMAVFLADKGEKEKAQQHLQRALEAPPRPGRAISDEARRAEINALLGHLGNL
jgi:tetratricopeptide (TPR) repeat protein